MLRFGLCCIFRKLPIKFKQTTARFLQQFPRREQLVRLSRICLDNVGNVQKSLGFAAKNNIGAFRILSPLFPRYTHPVVGYTLSDLPDAEEILAVLAGIRKFRKKNDIRLSFHPDQFNVLSSLHENVVYNTIKELEYHGMLSELAGADVINIHAGGRYQDKHKALNRLKNTFHLLSKRVRSRLTLENDDISFSPADLLPICSELEIPMVYDVHHHRCLPDELDEHEATRQSVALWNQLGREPYFHISSPKNGWDTGSPRPHSDYIDPKDFPPFWLTIRATIDVEAKAKELAVIRLMHDLNL